MRINDGRAIPNFINQAINNKDFTVYGDGTQTRSFCYVSDTVYGIDRLLKSSFQEPINIGNPEEYTILDLIKIIKSTINNTKSKLIFNDLPENDPKFRQPNIKLANKILNWSPEINLNEGLLKTIKYYNNL